MLAVIMAGGVGERFWPSSRRQRPKQLLDLTGRGSMIRLTLARLEGVAAPDEIYVLTNREQRDAILAEVSSLVPAANVIGEPDVRNTAPCIGLAAVVARARGGDRTMLVLPADHLVTPVERFRELVRAGARHVESHADLLTLGIRPTRAETGYGYIRLAEPAGDGAAPLFRVEAFLEKPDAERARRLVADGCLWNSGMFMWRTDTVLGGIATHLPELGTVLDRIAAGMGTRPLAEVLNEEYSRAPAISIDFGLMEKARNVVALRADFEWNDVGSWEFIRDAHPADGDGNVVVGDHILIDGSNNTIVSRDRLVAIVGVDDIVVVEDGGAILVCRRDRAQDVKRVVAELKERGREDLT
ncbi:MAG TPA: sugar phosphate nucleotidyltransferase [Candidatus Krumholzibacteria bacterium]|nr:sugar phosphate nucleotidyltransferase [Candidatus Krumholzibacteria bacterium]